MKVYKNTCKYSRATIFVDDDGYRAPNGDYVELSEALAYTSEQLAQVKKYVLDLVNEGLPKHYGGAERGRIRAAIEAL